MKKNEIFKNIIILLPIIFCIGLLILFFILGIKQTDEYVMKTVSENIGYNTIEAMKIITNSCSAITFMLVILLIILTAKNKNIGVCFALNVILCYVLNFFIKIIVSRERPIAYMLVTEDSFSFPSAHAMLSVAFYGFLAYMIIKFVKNKKLKIFGVFGVILATLLVGISRICLGVHYPTDIICGFLFGYIYLIVFLKLIKNYIIKEEKV